MTSLLDEGSSPLDNKAGPEHKDDETSESFFPKLKDIDRSRRKFLFMIGAIIACVILGVVLIITIVVVLVYSPSSYSKKKGLDVVPHGLISFNPNVASSYRDEVASLNTFMLQYNNYKSGGKMVLCSDNSPAPEGKFCYFDSSWIYGICPPVLDWNYGSMDPCVLLTLRQVTEPIQVYDKLEELPEIMPSKLQNHIFIRYKENNDVMPKNIWVSCTNEKSYTDPARGFPAYYLPYHDDPDYLPPLVGVILSLENKANNPEEIECKLWAKNIDHKKDDFATVKFTVLVQSD